MRGLADVMHEFRRPVVVEVLPVFEIEYVAARSADDEFNKGIEAAVAAIEMVVAQQTELTLISLRAR